MKIKKWLKENWANWLISILIFLVILFSFYLSVNYMSDNKCEGDCTLLATFQSFSPWFFLLLYLTIVLVVILLIICWLLSKISCPRIDSGEY